MSVIRWFKLFWKSWWCIWLENRAILDACVWGKPLQSRAVLSAAVVFCGFGAAWAQSSHYLEARAKYERKEYLGAMLPARKAVEEDGQNAAYRHLYGVILTELGQFSDAKDHLRIAVELKPRNAEYQYRWGALFTAENDGRRGRLAAGGRCEATKDVARGSRGCKGSGAGGEN